MAGTFSQIYIQVIFAVDGRRSLIRPSWEAELFRYMKGIISKMGEKPLAINGETDHIHILLGMRPSCCLSDLVREIKKASNDHINTRHLLVPRFQWQEGFGAFSYSHSSLDDVIEYILNQKEHHRTLSFKEEYQKLLQEFSVDHEEEHLFDWVE